MKALSVISFFFLTSILLAQELKPQDYLSSDFHKARREALRSKMPSNSVAVFFSNPIRNRSNDVDYVFHQDPDFYYLTGYKEPHSALLIFSENQKNANNTVYNEMLYVQEKNPKRELWTGVRLGVEGAKENLGFKTVYNNSEFLTTTIDFSAFDLVMHKKHLEFQAYNLGNETSDADLIKHFKSQLYNIQSTGISNSNLKSELSHESIAKSSVVVDENRLGFYMAQLRQIKTQEELRLLKKAIRISTIGQIEVMKAMHPGMSETEIQGIHEYVFKKYGSEYVGYPSIVGAGSNGCVLHYIENDKTRVSTDLVLMDLGAEYHGYTADVTRTIPADGSFDPEQRHVYDLVLEAQEAGIAMAVVGNHTSMIHKTTKKIINDGLANLGIIRSLDEKHNYFPHGTSHHIGLDVHDANTNGNLEANMVITVEPGIYIPVGSPCDEKWWGIAVRIEDDILITENGPINLSAEAPRRADEIEAMMKKPSIFDDIQLPILD